MRGTWPVALLLLASVATALWAAQPFWDLGALAPRGGSEAATIGLAAGFALVAAVALVGVLLIWLARKDARRAVRWFMLAAIAFGLLLGLTPFIVDDGTPLAWAGGILVAAAAAWLLRGAGAPAWTAAAVAAGGYAGLLAAVAGLAVLTVVAAAVCLYDAWAMRRKRMARVADAADALAAPLQVGRPGRLSLGLGDLLLPAALVAASADPTRGPTATVAALAGCAGLLAGLVLLAWMVRRGGDTPGTPFLCGGALAGIGAGLALA
ncbi:MAG TPA: presenilin family intramembrane aspartyl protease [Candidatus Thermoplasmatota archaeon]|nr:presenilin family intramembrane aspartyl protease [Candidatus Thermoplasmatota archaeon]